MTSNTLYATLGGGISVVVAIAVTIGLIFGAEIGSMADWLAAIATLAAFGAAIVAARYAAGAFGLESQRERGNFSASDGPRRRPLSLFGRTGSSATPNLRTMVAGTPLKASPVQRRCFATPRMSR